MEETLVITLPFAMRPQDKEILREKIVEDMKTGVVVLPIGSKAVMVPQNVEVVIEDERGKE